MLSLYELLSGLGLNSACFSWSQKKMFEPMKVLKTWEMELKLMNKIFVKNQTLNPVPRLDYRLFLVLALYM